MTRADTINVLNRLLVLHYRSLFMYLSNARPWNRFEDANTSEVLDHIIADQKATVDRLGEVIIENRGRVEFGEYPMEFTDKHDLSISFLLDDLIEKKRESIEVIGKCVQQLEDDPVAKSLAQESLGAAKAHLEALEQLPRSAVPPQ